MLITPSTILSHHMHQSLPSCLSSIPSVPPYPQILPILSCPHSSIPPSILPIQPSRHIISPSSPCSPTSPAIWAATPLTAASLNLWETSPTSSLCTHPPTLPV
ncbi:unnamed protein product [Closterium sp. Yama58-4]|nr:unnamed protein product [Closterium sp. Yama58-4]